MHNVSSIYLGDSGVGKTSIIHRFCNDTFEEGFSATLGVDLQVKMLNIDDRTIALQLWDTVRMFVNFLLDKHHLFNNLGWSRKVCNNRTWHK